MTLESGKKILDTYRSSSNHYGIHQSTANKASFFNRELDNYTIEIGGKTFSGKRVPVIHSTGKQWACDEPSSHFKNWYAALFLPESEYRRKVLFYYTLAMLTAHASGAQIAALYFCATAMLECGVEYPDNITVTVGENVYTASKADFPKMVSALKPAVEGNRKRVENDPILRSYYGLDVNKNKRAVVAVIQPDAPAEF